MFDQVIDVEIIADNLYQDGHMLKNVLATIGLIVVVKKGYEFYCEYQKMKQENEFYRTQKGNISSI